MSKESREFDLEKRLIDFAVEVLRKRGVKSALDSSSKIR